MDNHPGERFDLVHVDGCHEMGVAKQDLDNTLRLTNRYLIWDDTQMPHLNKLFEDSLQARRFTEVFLYPTLHYQHRIGIV
jgi:hypothetical protein